ncbi:hypothetical protein ORD22_10710 [Sporosarcina sp. GW1-11]|uniref:hypothetical protein n=1 Tax=Sporosarcina sp. GW1-11 TaxID=2899126 RepID=UPI00294FCD62|nr:hypothetical protein [Sporosarcina sp. GW1-11]MDV6378686.1 hypothetical protein [Sporosarcina sp. GW1-11]
MKKIYLLMITAAMLVACSNEEKQKTTEKVAPIEQNNLEVEEGLKAGTTEYDYATLLADEVSVNAKVKFVGIVYATKDGGFELISGVDNTADEIVMVDDIRLGERTNIDKGTAVTVYGSYNGKNADGVPVIKGIFIDLE